MISGFSQQRERHFLLWSKVKTDCLSPGAVDLEPPYVYIWQTGTSEELVELHAAYFTQDV